MNLPDRDDLSQQQKDILDLDFSQSYLISSSPGTGKTVLALYRAQRLANAHKKVLLLAYNRPLIEYTKNGVDSRIEVNTYHSWMYNIYRSKFGWNTKPPEICDYVFDWNQVLKDFDGVGNLYDHIILDEAQDFPIELVSFLRQISTNMTIFIDRNQSMEPQKTSAIDIEDFVDEVPITLDCNYRNSAPIAEAAQIFWMGKDKNSLAKPKPRSENDISPVVIKCDNNSRMNTIKTIIDNNRGLEIGIFTARGKVEDLYEQLRLAFKNLDVQYYRKYNKKAEYNKQNLDFRVQSAVRVVPYGVMKGLEFDVVIIDSFDKMKTSQDAVVDSNRAYVAITRAKSKLYILYESDKEQVGMFANVMKKLREFTKLFEWK